MITSSTVLAGSSAHGSGRALVATPADRVWHEYSALVHAFRIGSQRSGRSSDMHFCSSAQIISEHYCSQVCTSIVLNVSISQAGLVAAGGV